MSGRKNSGKKNGLTYARRRASTSTPANAMVEKINAGALDPAPGADGRDRRFRRLVRPQPPALPTRLVAANERVRTQAQGRHRIGVPRHIGIDLVAMCRQRHRGAKAPNRCSSRLFRTGSSLRNKVRRAGRHRRGLPAGRLRLIGGETARNAGQYGGATICRLRRRRAERGQLLPTDDVVEGDVLLGFASSASHSNASPRSDRVVALSGLGWPTPPLHHDRTLADALLEPTRIY